MTGTALAVRAALEWQESAGIRSTTLARRRGQIDAHREGSPQAPGSVLVVDEAGTIGTRQLARLLDHAEQQQVKVVLVGDPGSCRRSMPEGCSMRSSPGCPRSNSPTTVGNVTRGNRARSTAPPRRPRHRDGRLPRARTQPSSKALDIYRNVLGLAATQLVIATDATAALPQAAR